jgi:hypothetical protein
VFEPVSALFIEVIRFIKGLVEEAPPPAAVKSPTYTFSWIIEEPEEKYVITPILGTIGNCSNCFTRASFILAQGALILRLFTVVAL